MNEIAKMIIVLSVITGLSGLTLAGLKQATAVPIEEQVLKYVQSPVLKQVLAGCENDPVKERKKVAGPDGKTVMVFPAKKGGKLYAVAFEVMGKGYGGDLGVVTGFDVGSDTVLTIGITTSKETPGLGSRAAEPAFARKFQKHSLDKIALRSAGGDIDGIAGATVSSSGVTNAVSEAAGLYKALKPQILKEFSAG
ncbi:MAG: RnfABCDGE type electron transport complex subunit G [Thermodesulfobacteriota bacterium]